MVLIFISLTGEVEQFFKCLLTIMIFSFIKSIRLKSLYFYFGFYNGFKSWPQVFDTPLNWKMEFISPLLESVQACDFFNNKINNAMWFLRLGHKKPFIFHIIHWKTCFWNPVPHRRIPSYSETMVLKGPCVSIPINN